MIAARASSKGDDSATQLHAEHRIYRSEIDHAAGKRENIQYDSGVYRTP
jgi:hypothetical protein